MILTDKVLKDDKVVLPELFILLKDYLNDDFDHVSKKLENTLINVIWMPNVMGGLQNAINQAAQDALMKPDMLNLTMDTLMTTIKNDHSQEHLKKREKMEPHMLMVKDDIHEYQKERN
jgi:hypothetical protein